MIDLSCLPAELKISILGQLSDQPLPAPTSPAFIGWRSSDPIFSAAARTPFQPGLVPESALDQILSEGIAVVDDFLPERLLQPCIRALNSDQIQLRAASMNSVLSTWSNRSVRGDELRFLSDHDPIPIAGIRPVMDVLRGLADDIGASLGLCTRRVEMQLARYAGDGSGYGPHLDSTRSQAAGRALTAVLYLSDQGWEPEHGGCLRLHLDDGGRDLSPVGNRLVLFASKWLVHEVRPVYRRRFALTCFVHYDVQRSGRYPDALDQTLAS